MKALHSQDKVSKLGLLKEENRRLRANLAEATEELTQARRLLFEKEEELERASARADAAHNQLRKVRQSLTWRISSPLRALERWLGW